MPSPSISEGFWTYQLTDERLAPEITEKWAKYFKNDDLSESTGATPSCPSRILFGK